MPTSVTHYCVEGIQLFQPSNLLRAEGGSLLSYLTLYRFYFASEAGAATKIVRLIGVILTGTSHIYTVLPRSEGACRFSPGALVYRRIGRMGLDLLLLPLR